MQPELRQDTKSSGMDDKYLTFHLDERNYGIEISYLAEIVSLAEITEIPDMKDYVKGVVDLRGRVVPVIDARLRLGLPEKEYLERTCVIILRIHRETIGLIVDAVKEVIRIHKEDMDPIHNSNDSNQNHCIKAMSRVKEDIVILLDMEKLLAGDHSQLGVDKTGVTS